MKKILLITVGIIFFSVLIVIIKGPSNDEKDKKPKTTNVYNPMDKKKQEKNSNEIIKKISKQQELKIKKRVNQLKELLRESSITQEEYDAKRKEILDAM